jgi:hypothetical protein
MARKGPQKTRKRGRGAATMRHGLPSPGPCQCHPSVGAERPAHGCLPPAVLRTAAERLRLGKAVAALPPAELRAALEAKIGMPVGQVAEATFLSKLPLPAPEKADLARRHLRPPMPAGWRHDPDMWLDSNNIAHVLNQYEDVHNDFEFMGPFPIDFAAPDPYAGGGKTQCLMNEICEIRVQKALKNGTRSIGIVYNLDPHFKSGSHWVANYIDIAGHKCYYFDSYGMQPPAQVAKFMRWLTTQDKSMQLFYNGRRLQSRDTECGIYCCYFIIRMLMRDSFKQFTHRNPNDHHMLDLRDWLFST